MGSFLTDLGTNFRVEHYSGLSVMKHAHVHAQYELYFCTENVEQKSVINGVEYVYRYPCVILSPPYTVHSMSCDDPDAVDFDRYVFYFDEKMLSSYKEELVPKELRQMIGGRIFRLSVEQADYLKRLLTWCDEMPESVVVREQELTCMLFLNKLFEICSGEQTVLVEGSPDYIRRVLRYVADHMSSPIGVQEVAEEFSVSRSKLDRDFKKFTGITVHDYLESCRINQAKGLLGTEPSLSVQEIAARCGFESEPYFFPFFKRHTGMTPVEYRSRFQTNHETKPQSGNHKNKKEKENGKDYIYGCGEYGIC